MSRISPEGLESIRQSKLGANNPMFGKKTLGFTGHKHTEEAKNRLRDFMSKRVLSQEHKDKIAKAHIGIEPWNKNKETGLKPFLGKTHSFKTKMKMSESGRKVRGSNRGNLCRQVRTSFLYRQWRSDVFLRDNFTCQECGVRSGNGKAVYLEAHHCRISFSEIMNKYKISMIEEALLCPELWDINNGLTLCVPCHDRTKKGRPHDKQ